MLLNVKIRMVVEFPLTLGRAKRVDSSVVVGEESRLPVINGCTADKILLHAFNLRSGKRCFRLGRGRIGNQEIVYARHGEECAKALRHIDQRVFAPRLLR